MSHLITSARAANTGARVRRARWGKSVQQVGRDVSPNEDRLNIDLAELLAIVERYRSLMAEIDGAIQKVAEALRVSQPPVSGKFDIRWWLRAGDGYRTPMLVQWKRTRRGKMEPQVTTVKSALLRKGPPSPVKAYELNWEETRRLFKFLSALLKIREEAMAKIRNSRKGMDLWQTKLSNIAWIAGDSVSDIQYRCLMKLKNNGYELDPEYEDWLHMKDTEG